MSNQEASDQELSRLARVRANTALDAGCRAVQGPSAEDWGWLQLQLHREPSQGERKLFRFDYRWRLWERAAK